MRVPILYLLRYYCFFVFFFVVAKGLFLLFNAPLTAQLSLSEITQVFLHGLKMDLSAAAYLTLLPGVMTAVAFCLPNVAAKVIKVYTCVLLPLVTLLVLGDLSLYPAWESRVDQQVFPYLSQPGAIFRSVSVLQLLLSLLAWGALSALFLFLFLKCCAPRRAFNNLRDRRRRVAHATLALFVTALLILPIRGGVDTAPLNFSSVYFSEKPYANHAAYNAFWCFFHALTHNDYARNPFHYTSDDEAREVVTRRADQSLHADSLPVYVHATDGRPVHVVLVILESFSNRVIASLDGIDSLTPNIDRMVDEGIAFTNLYATGSRSDRGLSALLAQYPALSGGASSLLGFPDKMRHADYLPTLFKRNGYDVAFYYGGDLDFYNTKMMLIQSGVDHVYSRSDFPASVAMMSKWGAPDEYLYSSFADFVLAPRDKPLFAMVYNISTHEPFDLPSHVANEGDESQRYLNAVAYCDSCLGAFVDRLRHSPEWAHTLLVVTADHTSLLPEPRTDITRPESYRIPMIWTGGAVTDTLTIDNICSQTDLGTTLAQQLGLERERPASPLLKNFFSQDHFAFYFRKEGWGVISPEMALYRDIDNDVDTYFYGENCPFRDSVLRFAESYVQYLHDDFVNK